MGRAPCCDKANVKKGPWSPEEDAQLKSFIEQNGTGGNWITLPRKAGLKRCGKSCRLRWINYLRPDIKHGSFTEEEERTIYGLHAQIGSRWSLIAAQLPGRTDNDIKNYWNTRLKKKLLERSNAAIYGRPHLYQFPANVYRRSGTQDQTRTAARESLLHSCTMNQQPSHYQLYQQQQQQYFLHQHQHQQVIQGHNDIILFPASLNPNPMFMENELVGECGQRKQMAVGSTHSNGARGDDRNENQRLMVVDRGLRSIIVTDECTVSASGSSRTHDHGMSSSMGSAHPLQDTQHNTVFPSSSCSTNLSCDRNSFSDRISSGIQIADSSETAYKVAIDDLGARAAADPTATMSMNTSILSPEMKLHNVAAVPASTTSTQRLDDTVFFGEVLAEVNVYNRPIEFSEVAVVDGVKKDSQTGLGVDGGGTLTSGDWWTTMDIMSPPSREENPSSGSSSISALSMNWTISTPRCGAEDLYVSPRAQLASQAHGFQSLDGMNSYTDSYFSKLII